MTWKLNPRLLEENPDFQAPDISTCGPQETAHPQTSIEEIAKNYISMLTEHLAMQNNP